MRLLLRDRTDCTERAETETSPLLRRGIIILVVVGAAAAAAAAACCAYDNSARLSTDRERAERFSRAKAAAMWVVEVVVKVGLVDRPRPPPLRLLVVIIILR
jgi:hypothetical protein